MNLIIIIGSGAVGKMTVGQQLMKITDYRLFHNHMMIEPVIDIFGGFNAGAINRLRDVVFDEFMKTQYEGMIFTFMWAFDMQSDWDYIKNLSDKFEATGGTVYYVELVADQAVRLERNKTENRLANKASKRDLLVSGDRIIREETKYRLVSRDGEVPFENYIKIDNTNLEPDVVARMIKERFNLQDKSRSEIGANLRIEPVREDELSFLLEAQHESFMPLYEKYKDDKSPATETLDRIKERAAIEGRQYYFIVYRGARIGALNLDMRQNEQDTSNGDVVGRIAPIFIRPAYQNRGYGYCTLLKVFELHPEVNVWRLDTILEEPGNCHLYEKCGFVKVGEPHPVNAAMTLVAYERRV